MKRIINVSIPIILTISLVLLFNTGGSNIYGQIIGQDNQTNQTSGLNATEQSQQQLEQSNQQIQQSNQQIQQSQEQKEQAQEQLNQSNQTQQQTNQSKQQDPEMNEKLLNYTNAAILALNDDNTTAAEQHIVQIQNALINASGKQVVVVPASAIQSDEEDSE